MDMRVRELSLEKLKEIILDSKSKREVVGKITGNSGNRNEMDKLSEIIEMHDLDISHFKSVFKFNDPLMYSLVKESFSFKEVGEKLGKSIPGVAMNRDWYKKIKNYVEKNKLDISHFDSQLNKSRGFNVRYDENEIFTNPSFVSKQTLKQRFLKQRIKKIECDECGIFDWRGKPIQLALDHIDGNSVNNVLNNLRLLCPNCHSQTETFAGKNLKICGAEKRASERASILEEKKQKAIQEKESKIEILKNKILSAGIDFSKLGRNKPISEILNVYPQKAGLWLKTHMPEQYALLKRKAIKSDTTTSKTLTESTPSLTQPISS